MSLRGILVDQGRRQAVVEDLHETLDTLEDQLTRIVRDGVDFQGFVWTSPTDLKELFYDHLKIPEIKNKGRPTTDANALEKIQQYTVGRQIARHIQIMREISKRITVLQTQLGADGRIHTSYNIAGTNTGRLSSSEDEFGEGGNLQNLEEGLRSIYVADPGMKFAKFDAKSGESYVVGALEWNIFNDGRYLDAVDSGDVHTAVAKLVWRDLGWTGDKRHDKEIAERPYYRHHSYRFMCKKLGHGSNYGGQPFTLAQQSRLPISEVQRFQPLYFGAFPAHRRWQDWTADRILRTGNLVSLLGRKRWFHGRRNEPATIREAIAYDPQSSLADYVNQRMLDLWQHPIAELVANDHDALTFTYPEEQEDEIVPKLWASLPGRIILNEGREMVIPFDGKVGWNRGDFSDKNPDGLKDYNGTDTRTRQAQVGVLDRPFHRTNRRFRKPGAF
jgi:DNA polymerase-1